MSTQLTPSQTPRSSGSRVALVGRGLRAWAATWRVQRSGHHRLVRLLEDGPVVLGFWHEDLAVLGPLHADRGFVGMVSRSDDGGRLAEVLATLGYDTVRGSSSRGARAVALAGMRALRAGRSLAIAVDGPRGPRRSVQPGAWALAEWAGRPLVLVGCAASPAVRLGSWDRQRLPAPGARVHVSYGVAHSGHPGRLRRELEVLGLTAPSGSAP